MLGDAWKRNLDAFAADGPVDLLCFTGDLADWGRRSEYEAITPFLDETRARVGVPWERVFVVPGNHDIARKTEEVAWSTLRSIEPHEYDRFSAWMAGDKPLRGIDSGFRDAVLERQSAYRTWVRDTLKRPGLVPDATSPHPRLGYRASVTLPGRAFPVYVIGLDSAWLAGDNNDNGKLMLTDAQVGRLASSAAGDAFDGLRVALVHHPLEQLADGAVCRRLLSERVDLLLRGHLHDTDPSTWKDPTRELRELAAGCLFEHDHYPSACHVITATCDEQGRPLAYDLHLRAWSSKGSHWFADNSLNERVRDGRLRWWPSVQTSGGDKPDDRERRKELRWLAPVCVPQTEITAPTSGSDEPDDRELRKALLAYFDRVRSIRMILRDAGVDVDRIAFENSASEVWDEALPFVRRQRLLRRLFELACEEYPAATDLRAIASRLQR